MSLEISEYCIYADMEQQKHVWFIGCDDPCNGQALIQSLDNQLCALNDDYASARKYNLKPPEIQVLPVQRFYAFMNESGKMGSQNKFPRVLNADQAKRWLTFLSPNP